MKSFIFSLMLISFMFGCVSKIDRGLCLKDYSDDVDYHFYSGAFRSLNIFLEDYFGTQQSRYEAKISKIYCSGNISYIVYVYNRISGFPFRVSGAMSFDSFNDLCVELIALNDSFKINFLLTFSELQQPVNSSNHLELDYWENRVIHALISGNIDSYDENIYRLGFSLAVSESNFSNSPIQHNRFAQEGYVDGRVMHTLLKMKYYDDKSAYDSEVFTYFSGNFDISDVKLKINQLLKNGGGSRGEGQPGMALR